MQCRAECFFIGNITNKSVTIRDERIFTFGNGYLAFFTDRDILYYFDETVSTADNARDFKIFKYVFPNKVIGYGVKDASLLFTQSTSQFLRTQSRIYIQLVSNLTVG